MMSGKQPKYPVGSRVKIVLVETPQGFPKYPELELFKGKKGKVIKTESVIPMMGASITGTDPLAPPATELFYVYTVLIGNKNQSVRTLEESLEAS